MRPPVRPESEVSVFQRGNRWQWDKGFCPNPRGRPRRNRARWVWSESTAVDAFRAASTPQDRQRVAQAIYQLALRDPPVWWAMRAVAQAHGLDWSLIQRTGHLPKPKVYFYG
jgi:hypothetical protein